MSSSTEAAPLVSGTGTSRSTRRPVVVVQPSSGWSALNLQELWEYRDLLLILAGRDVKLRYKQTALGILWVVLQPIIAALIFTVIFGRFAKLPSDGSPYLLFVFCGLLPWTYFSGAVQRASNSLIADSRLISKVYFPRLLIPIASTLSVSIDFGVSLVILFGMMAAQGVAPTWSLLALPLFFLLATLLASGVSLWLSALNVHYRDFSYALPFLIQIWLYASPVAYAASIVPERWKLLYSLNPAVGMVEGFRWAVLGRSSLDLRMLLVLGIGSLLVFWTGLLFFRRIERSFADVI
jgi:lipopolysaccharide transport system permease protein